MRWALPLLLALCVLPAVGLRLSGQLYELGPGPDLAPVAETLVVEARSGEALAGQVVATRGAYSLDIAPGDYRIVASSPSGEVRASENVSLRSDTRLDLILLPSLDLPELTLNESLIGNLTLPAGRREGTPFGVVAAAGAAAAGALLFIWLRRRRAGPAPLPVPGTLPDDLQAMVRVLEQEGGRLTQKELRKRLGHSEAKVSLMVADLENRGLARKFKVGRGNIVVLEKAGGEGSPPGEESKSPL